MPQESDPLLSGSAEEINMTSVGKYPLVTYTGITPVLRAHQDTALTPALFTRAPRTRTQKIYFAWNSVVATLEAIYRKLLHDGFNILFITLTVSYLINLINSCLFTPDDIELRLQDDQDTFIISASQIYLTAFLNSLMTLFDLNIPGITYNQNIAPSIGRTYCGDNPGISVLQQGSFLITAIGKGGILQAEPFSSGCSTGNAAWSVNLNIPPSDHLLASINVAQHSHILALRVAVLSSLPLLISVAFYFRNQRMGVALQELARGLTRITWHLVKMPVVFTVHALQGVAYILQKLVGNPLYYWLMRHPTGQQFLTAIVHPAKEAITTARSAYHSLPAIYNRSFFLLQGGDISLPTFGIAGLEPYTTMTFEQNLAILADMPTAKAVDGILIDFAHHIHQVAYAGELNEQRLFGHLFGPSILNQLNEASTNLSGTSSPQSEVQSIFDNITIVIKSLSQRAAVIHNARIRAQTFADIAALQQQTNITLCSLLRERSASWVKKHFASMNPQNITMDYLRAHWPVLSSIIAVDAGSAIINVLPRLNAALRINRSSWREQCDRSQVGIFFKTMPTWLEKLCQIQNPDDSTLQTIRSNLDWLYLSSHKQTVEHVNRFIADPVTPTVEALSNMSSMSLM